MDQRKFASKELATYASQISRVSLKAFAEAQRQEIDVTPGSAAVSNTKIETADQEAYAQLKEQ